MDIENMHPFCLPFGFCHDATSSTISAEFLQSSPADSHSNQTISAGNKDKLNRSKTSSPSDDLFRHLNSASSALHATSQSLLNDDLIIGSSTSLDLNAEETFYSSLDLDINHIDLDIDRPREDDDDHVAFSEQHKTNPDHDDDLIAAIASGQLNDPNDWFCHSPYSSFSPTGAHGGSTSIASSASSLLRHRKSLIYRSALAQNHNQVFQHAVDPIDIKSSPTLAQLNLNTNDDPTDGLWDSPVATLVGGHSAGVGVETVGVASGIGSSTSILSSSCSSSSSSASSSSSSSLALSSSAAAAAAAAAAAVAPASSVSAAAAATNIPVNSDLLPSNCTSISSVKINEARNGQVHASIASNLTCNHQHLHVSHTQHQSSHLQSPNRNHHQQQHHHHPNQQPPQHNPNSQQSHYAAGDAHSQTSTCQHHLYHLHHHHLHDNFHSQSASGRLAANSANRSHQANCPVDTAFRKPDLHQQYSASSCCQTLLTTAPPNAGQPTSGGNDYNPKPTDTLGANSDKLTHANCLSNQHLNRSASPAQVTSSSSPLSSMSTNSIGNENRPVDNKLKENIEYLTALLCNGQQKLDSSSGGLQQQQHQHQHQLQQHHHQLQQPQQQPPQQHQQPQQQLQNQQGLQQQQSASISSTMVRSYATLAHSLSTGPKLLERQQVPMNTNNSAPSAASNGCEHHANEATPCVLGQHQHQHQHHYHQQHVMGNGNPLKRLYTQQWANMAQVESSVSAADSTDGQVSNQSSERLCPASVCACSNYQHQHHQQPQQQQRPSDLKVLSSLLNSDKCPPAYQHADQQPPTPAAGWTLAPQTGPADHQHHHNHHHLQQPHHHHHYHHHQQQQQQQQQQLQQQQPQPMDVVNPPNEQPATPPSSIPVNGKPITLTPIASSIIQTQQAKIRPGGAFAQPASPSASSTTSSGGNNDIGTPATTSAPPTAKRQRAGQLKTAAGPTGKSVGRAGRPSSLSTECSFSSHDEGFSSQIDNDDCNTSNRDSEDDDDDEDDVDSDDESFYGDYTNSDLIGASISDNDECKWTLNMGRTRRNGQKRYFWQYNVQSKGPKGTRICSADESDDPFVLPEASDPVFSSDCQVEGVKHSGKARRGDGNDLTPNPRKLLMIGLELKRLGKVISELAPVTDLPINARNKTRKEKNKLASRACRLKKKAQHEANKIKLYGLQREHKQVVLAIYDIRKLLNETLLRKEQKAKELQASRGANQASKQSRELPSESAESNSNELSNNDSDASGSVKTIAEQCSTKVAGQTSDYVNSVLEKVVSGCIDGGLET